MVLLNCWTQPGKLHVLLILASYGQSKEHSPNTGRIGKLDEGWGSLEKSCHDMEKSGKMLREKNRMVFAEEKTAEASFVCSGLEIFSQSPFSVSWKLQQGSNPEEAQSLLTARNSSLSSIVAVMMGWHPWVTQSEVLHAQHAARRWHPACLVKQVYWQPHHGRKPVSMSEKTARENVGSCSSVMPPSCLSRSLLWPTPVVLARAQGIVPLW